MSFRAGYSVAEEEDWEIVERDWWRTSFRDVPWSYVSPSDRMATKPQRRKFLGHLFSNSWPRMNSALCFPSVSSSKEHRASEDDDSLNVEHVGVQVAQYAVADYERDVGFHFTGFPDFSSEELNLSSGMDLSVEVDEKELAAGNKKRWDELLEDLMNGPAFDNTTDSDESLEGSFIGSLSSSGSIDSVGMPSTPKPKASLHDIEIKDTSPTGSVSGLDYHPHLLSPTRSLNAAASSFVPTFCSQLNDEPLQFPSLVEQPKPSPAGTSHSVAFANFTFPTLNAQASPIKAKREDGIFNEPQGHNPTAPDSANGLLPPFLQEPSQRNRTRKSRTREIVDRLRSRLAPTESDTTSQVQPLNVLSPKYASLSPSPIGEESTLVPPRLSVSEDGGDRLSRLSSPSCEDDGWIDVSQPSVTSSNQKSKRARELLFALTRRRTDSLTSENLKEMMSSSEPTPNTSRPQNVSPSPSPSPNPPALQTTSDGWMESSAVSNHPPDGHKKTKSRTAAQGKEANKHHGQTQHNNNNHNHNRKKSSNHVSRTSTSSASHSHPQQQHSQFSASSSCYPPPSTGGPGAAVHSLSPHMVPPQTMPYFFPAYPAVSMPVPYTAFMQMPAYHMNAMSMHAGAQPMQFAPMPAPTTMGMQPLHAGSAVMKTTMASPGAPTHMNILPAFQTTHSQPLW
ncbi:hypothetical protein BDN70DRAFT_880364 [Pholiota conissans]|uniref:Uncharacterized protein n=1 Tax=Pholiota conissans TaxID=109636 RepID=A0A9P6CZ54_9AGAR|nr:hypothetical protein BDN70DRAFT_880364 [Pholiota conissans]